MAGAENAYCEVERMASLPSRLLRLPRGLRGGAGNSLMMLVSVVGGSLLLLFMFVTLCYATVPPNHAGIKFNTFSKQVDTSHLYTAGRYLSSPFVTYITFPLNVQNVVMTLESRTSEGYPLDLTVAFQYQLVRDKILDLYEHYTVKYAPVFQRNVRAALMKALSTYHATDLYTKRAVVLDDMQARVDNVLKDCYARCWGIQFDDVKQPHAFELNLLQTQLQQWFANTKLAEQKVSAITARTAVLKAEFDKNISVVNSTATAECQYIISEAEANSNNFQNEAQAHATLLTNRARAESSAIIREATADGELTYQKALAAGSSNVLTETAEAGKRTIELQSLRLKYWKELVGLSEWGMIQFQKLHGSYKQLEDVKFLVGFANTYATAEASHGASRSLSNAISDVLELAAMGGHAAAIAAAEATQENPESDANVRRKKRNPNADALANQEDLEPKLDTTVRKKKRHRAVKAS